MTIKWPPLNCKTVFLIAYKNVKQNPKSFFFWGGGGGETKRNRNQLIKKANVRHDQIHKIEVVKFDYRK